MRQFEPVRAGPPAVASAGTGFSSSWRGAPKAAFLSQLIAERYHLATQRSKHQAPLGEVLRTYDAGGRISVRRVPPGYRMSIDA